MMEPECKYCGSEDGICDWPFDKNEDYAPCGCQAAEEDTQELVVA